MERETSKIAYKKAVESGLVSKLRLRVFKVLCDHGDMTANEMKEHAPDNQFQFHGSKRLSELESMNLIEVKGQRKCKITDNQALIWGITGKEPSKFERPKTKIELIKEALQLIEEGIESGAGDMFADPYIEVFKSVKSKLESAI